MHPVIEETLSYLGKKVPCAGGAVFAFRGNEILERSCFGYRDVETKKPVTEDTLFQIASMTKSFCTVLISMLADEGLLDWDKPVRDYWPEYHAYDEYVSAHMTLRDLACHRSGICSHNKQRQSMFRDQCRDLHEMALRSLDLAPCFGFREKFAYQNEMYGILGYLAERVTGKKYEDLLRERIGNPLGMELQFRNYPVPGETRYAAGYDTKKDGLVKVDPEKAAPCTNCAGGIVTNLKSIEKWIRFLAAGCVTESGERLLSEKTYKNLIRPIIFWGDVPYPDQRKQYALGLAPSVYRGEKLVYHGGSLWGYRSAQGFFPEKNAGYVVMINSTSQPYSILKAILCDIALGTVEEDYHAECDRRVEIFLKEKNYEENCLPKQDVTEEDLKKYGFEGVYENPAYGEMTFSYVGDNELKLSYAEDSDEYLIYRGSGVFQRAGAPLTDVRFGEGGETAVFSKGEFYSPNLFKKVR